MDCEEGGSNGSMGAELGDGLRACVGEKFACRGCDKEGWEGWGCVGVEEGR